MDFHPELARSEDYRGLIGTNKIKAECIYFSGIGFSLLSVFGTVDAPNPGANPRLEFAFPQGFNPKILLLNLVFDQEPGIWPQVITPKPVGYTMGLKNCDVYDQVEIVGNETIDIHKITV